MGLFVFINFIAIAPRFTYNKKEKLKSRKLIEHLFSKGKSFSAFPIKVLYNFVDDSDAALQAGVTVSSRNFKKAVQRNRIKRVMREAYRLQKIPLQQLLLQRHQNLILFFIYVGKELPDFGELNKKMQVVLQRLSDIVNQPGEK